MVEAKNVPDHDGTSAAVFTLLERLSIIIHVATCLYAYHAVSAIGPHIPTWMLALYGSMSLGVHGITINAAMHDLLGQPFFSYYAQYIIRHYSVVSNSSRFLEYVAAPLGVAAFVFAAFGLRGLNIHISTSIMVVYGLAVFDYVVHYGLHKEEVFDKYSSQGFDQVPQSVACTWADNHSLTKWFTFNVTTHAHHHHNPRVPGSRLVPIRGSPVTPLPEAAIALLVPFTPVFKALMHP
eukprot:scaffold244315_cov54-Prasinocladus_malaysianus.AAC.1